MRFSLYSKKNQLDEMQEQTLRKIEGRGFWLMWGGLLAAWIVQTMFGAADKAAGEWVVFMIGCIYMCVACPAYRTGTGLCNDFRKTFPARRDVRMQPDALQNPGDSAVPVRPFLPQK